MSAVAVNKMVRDLERRSGAVEQLHSDTAGYLGQFALSDAERDAVLDLDAAALVALDIHPLLVRSLLIAAGVPPQADLYGHEHTLRTHIERT